MAYNGSWYIVPIDVKGIVHSDLLQKRSDRKNSVKRSIRKMEAMECCKICPVGRKIKGWINSTWRPSIGQGDLSEDVQSGWFFEQIL